MGIFDIFKSKEGHKDAVKDSNDNDDILTNDELVSTEGIWHEFRVTFNSNTNQWFTNKSVYGAEDYNPITMNTGIFMTREQIKAFIEGLINIKDKNSEEEPSWENWIEFLKKTKLFDDWNFEVLEDFMFPHGFFWHNHSEIVASELDIKSDEDVKKCIDKFIELARVGKNWGPPVDDNSDQFQDLPVLSTDLEILFFDDPNNRQWIFTEEAEDSSTEDDKEFTTDIKLSRENIETILKAAVETYNELNSSFDFEFNCEKAFYYWIKKLRVMPEFNDFWFPEKNQIIGMYYSSESTSEVSSLGVKVLYNLKEVECLWTYLWQEEPYAPYNIFYGDWDSAGPDEIDEAIDEFLEGENRGIDSSHNIVTKPSNAPVKKGTIKI